MSGEESISDYKQKKRGGDMHRLVFLLLGLIIVLFAFADSAHTQVDPQKIQKILPVDVKFRGGAVSMLHLEYLSETSDYPETDFSREVTQEKTLTYHIYWLEANAEVNSNLSFDARISNANATKLWRWTAEGEPQEDVAWISFQYAYMNVKTVPATFKIGLLAVDRANEPLEAHFTPKKTSWTPFVAATMGSLKGASINIPLVGGKTSGASGFGLATDFTVSVHSAGTGKTTIKEKSVIPPEEKKYNWPSLDFILRFPVSAGTFSIEPLFALRTFADDTLRFNPSDGKGDHRFSYGFTGSYRISRKFDLGYGLGFSSFNNEHTEGEFVGSRIISNQVVDVFNSKQHNSTMFAKLRPNLIIGQGALIGEVKYSTFNDKSFDEDFTFHYVNASILYFFRAYKRLMLMPCLRFFGEFYDNPNKHEEDDANVIGPVEYSKIRICPQMIVVLPF